MCSSDLAIIAPKMVVVMGEDALNAFNEIDLPLGRRLDATPGSVQKLTPSIDALYTPDIDEALDEEQSKREFWSAFRVLGDWYSAFPPY